MKWDGFEGKTMASLSITLETNTTTCDPIITTHSLFWQSVSPLGHSLKETNNVGLFQLALERKKILDRLWSREREVFFVQ
jgi:hypothetical protein